eukprot:TRINITY_DN9851_c0_g1_i1.p1 TRINITY_DN9851_c0_g1~~TRINITY_DN9851_c0_g1_i1.p1  ORF type:complete len:363 (+),score=79.23 TRINITY_DN9851_c0_g1_i1:63-1151(+)
MTDFWLLTVPRSSSDFNSLKRAIADQVRSSHVFEVPELRVGTYNSLINLSYELKNMDRYVESQANKILQQYHKISQSEEPIPVRNTSAESYLTHFRWEDARYPRRKPLLDIAESIQADVGNIDDELRAKVSSYSAVEGVLAKADKDKNGSLLTRDISDDVREAGIELAEDRSEYLQSVFVVVPVSEKKNFLRTYEQASEFVLPRSAIIVTEDHEYALFVVVMFKHSVETFRGAFLSSYSIRKYDPGMSMDPEKRDILVKKQKKLKKQILRWCLTNYSETFIAWIHLKCIRCFVESILRHGLPADFNAFLIQPKSKGRTRLEKTLHKLYIDQATDFGEFDAGSHQALVGDDVFHPYVFLDIRV